MEGNGRKRPRSKHGWTPQPGDAVRAKFKQDKPNPRFCSAWEGKGSYFPGSVAHVHEDDAVDVMFNDGFFETRVLAKNVQRANHRVLRQWRSIGHPLIGARLVRLDTFATVACWCPESPPGSADEWPVLFVCIHDDDDEEQLTMREVEDGIRRLGDRAGSGTSEVCSNATPAMVALREGEVRGVDAGGDDNDEEGEEEEKEEEAGDDDNDDSSESESDAESDGDSAFGAEERRFAVRIAGGLKWCRASCWPTRTHDHALASPLASVLSQASECVRFEPRCYKGSF